MSIEDAFRSELSREIEKLNRENQKVHAAVIRKHKELMKIHMNLVTEVCPDCGCENTMEWSVVNKGYQAFCPTCGFLMMLCSECMIDSGFCDWNSSPVLCHRMVEGFWKNLADVSFHEDKEGKLVLEKGYRLMIGTREAASFPAETEREEIWHWFDEHHPRGVVYLLYGEEAKESEYRTNGENVSV